MAVVRLAYIMIKSNPDVECIAEGPNVAGKYRGKVRADEKPRGHILFTTGYVYNTTEEAVTAVEQTVEDIRNDPDIPAFISG